jgi:hypothetical protein
MSNTDISVVAQSRAQLALVTDLSRYVSRYSDGLRARLRFPAEATDFSLLHSVKTDSGANPASSRMGTGDWFPEGVVKRPQCEANNWPPSSAEVKNVGAIHSPFHTSSWRCAYLIKHRDNFTYLLLHTPGAPILLWRLLSEMGEERTHTNKSAFLLNVR